MTGVIRIGDSGDTVRAIQKMLTALAYRFIDENPDGTGLVTASLVADGVFGPQTEAVLADFQRDEGLVADGVVGPRTMAALEAAFSRRQAELHSPGVDALGVVVPTGPTARDEMVALPRLPFERVEADRPKGYEEGYAHLWMRADVCTAYKAVLVEARKKGAVLTSSGGRRDLNATVSEGRSATSMHYLGRALDLFLYSGMVDPERDPYVITMPAEGRRALGWRAEVAAIADDGASARAIVEEAAGSGTAAGSATDRWYWTVWARCSGNAVEMQTLDKPITYKDRRGTGQVTGRFINLTDLFGRHGFRPIPPRASFFRLGGNMIGAEWWHFQYEAGLMPQVSTFGAELLRVYSEATLLNTPPWQHRHKVFGRDWR